MSEEKLSVRLEAASDTPYDLRDLHGRADLLREAAQLARRVEEAPSGEVAAGYNGPCGVYACTEADNIAMSAMVSQRVRLVREE